MKADKLWTRDFTILTVGSVISIFGNALSGFAINLMVLEFSDSVFLFVLYMVVFCFPKIIIPLIAGPLLDSFSRRKAIYTLDFISAAIFIALFFLLSGGFFNYIVFLCISFTLGTIDGFYMVAYESLYPVLISEGNYRKAYSVSSIIMPLSTIMLPVSAFIYENVGITQIFMASAMAFFVAACFETQIRADETHLRSQAGRYSFKEFKSSFREGVNYIKGEKGLLVITSYFFFMMFANSAQSLMLPYFRDTPQLGVMLYTLVMGGFVAGRLIGGLVQYKIEYPKDHKFMIAMIVYISICFIEGAFLFTPVFMMVIMTFLVGILGVTSYNIRISATQSYVPDDKRARFNGAFCMFMSLGTIIGQLSAGALAELIPIRAVVVGFNALCLVASFAIMLRGKHHVKPIYNRKV